MKTTTRLCFLAYFVLLMNNSYSAIITPVVTNGDWENTSTWDLGRIPGDLDIVTIPTGITVIISSNLYHSVPRQPDLSINVYGILQMVGEGQINIGCGSTICVFETGSIPATGCNCNQINLGAGGAEWKGMVDNTLIGGQCITGSCVLLVTLTDFSGKAIDDQVHLSWSSSQELNFDQFIVEKSVDGISFQEAGEIQGSHASGASYSYVDKSSSNGLVYYRLKMLDNDQSFSYSNVIAVEVFFNSISVYPNPVERGEGLQVISNANELQPDLFISVKDLSGKEYATYSFSGEEKLFLDLPSGLYWIVISGDNYFVTAPLIVK